MTSRDATPTLAEHLASAPFALALSSGFFGFYAHTGVMMALEEHGLAPMRLSGSSAGSLVAGLWSSGLPARAIADELTALRRADFWDPAPGLGLLRGERFLRHVERLLPSRSFEGCATPVAISVFDLGARRTLVLERGELASAICASCAFPGLLQPVRREGRLLTDGGIGDRPGLAGLASVTPHTTLHHDLWRLPKLRAAAAGTITLHIADLPRVHPFRLDAGVAAMAVAHRAVLSALRGPVAPRLTRS